METVTPGGTQAMLTWETLNKEILPRVRAHHLTESRIKCTKEHMGLIVFPL